MTARQAQIECAQLREDLDATNERVRVLEELVGALKAPANGKALAAALANAVAPAKGRWLDFVKFGDKPCAGGCGTVIPSGHGRAWYEPKTAAAKAQLFCEPCGQPREGVTP